MTLDQPWVIHMMPDDKAFYRELGQRIAQLRKTKGLTQVQLAEILGIAQQTLAHYEGGSLRIAVALLKPLAQTLDVSIEQLLDEPATASKNKRGPDSKLQQQIDKIRQLPRTKQQFVMDMLDTVIQQSAI